MEGERTGMKRYITHSEPVSSHCLRTPHSPHPPSRTILPPGAPLPLPPHPASERAGTVPPHHRLHPHTPHQLHPHPPPQRAPALSATRPRTLGVAHLHSPRRQPPCSRLLQHRPLPAQPPPVKVPPLRRLQPPRRPHRHPRLLPPQRRPQPPLQRPRRKQHRQSPVPHPPPRRAAAPSLSAPSFRASRSRSSRLRAATYHRIV